MQTSKRMVMTTTPEARTQPWHHPHVAVDLVVAEGHLAASCER